VVVGSISAFFPDGSGHAWIWTAALGLVDLNTYLPTLGIDLTGWTITDAWGVSADGRIIAGTGTHNGTDEAWIATLRPPCRADFNHDGVRNVTDIFAFLAAWFAQSNLTGPGHTADFNNDNAVNVSDIFAFLAAWFVGCP
jgi:hypothetical protein